jgi:UDP-2-acetamido-3-amino-2,3-dideoxy-glucuronate N-acetyltransferase
LNNTPRTAVIGNGAWGKNHTRILRELGSLRSVYDSEPAQLENVPESTSFLGNIWADKRIDAVVIATPPNTHCRLVLDALAHGKHVLVEKPMASRLLGTVVMRTRAKCANKILMVGHLMRYHPGFVKLLEIVQSGKIGKLEYVYSNRLQPGKIRTEENSLWSLAPHDVSMLTAIAGQPQSATCIGSDYRKSGVADIVTATLRFPNEVNGHFFVSWLHPEKERAVFAIGREGSVCLHEFPQCWRLRVNGIMVFNGAGDEPLRHELIHFLDCIANNKKPLTNGEDGRIAVAVLAACDKSMKHSGKLVKI